MNLLRLDSETCPAHCLGGLLGALSRSLAVYLPRSVAVPWLPRLPRKSLDVRSGRCASAKADKAPSVAPPIDNWTRLLEKRSTPAPSNVMQRTFLDTFSGETAPHGTLLKWSSRNELDVWPTYVTHTAAKTNASHCGEDRSRFEAGSVPWRHVRRRSKHVLPRQFLSLLRMLRKTPHIRINKRRAFISWRASLQ